MATHFHPRWPLPGPETSKLSAWHLGNSRSPRQSVLHMTEQGIELKLLDGNGKRRIHFLHQSNQRRIYIFHGDQTQCAVLTHEPQGTCMEINHADGAGLALRIADSNGPQAEITESTLTRTPNHDHGWDLILPRVRFRIYLEEQAPRLTILDALGRERMKYFAGDMENWIEFYDASRQKRAELVLDESGPSISMLDANHKPRALLQLHRHRPILTVLGNTEANCLSMELAPEAIATDSMKTPQMELRLDPEFSLGFGAPGTAMQMRMHPECLRLSGKCQDHPFMLRLDDSCTAGMIDEQGQLRSLLRMNSQGLELSLLDVPGPTSARPNSTMRAA